MRGALGGAITLQGSRWGTHYRSMSNMAKATVLNVGGGMQDLSRRSDMEFLAKTLLTR